MNGITFRRPQQEPTARRSRYAPGLRLAQSSGVYLERPATAPLASHLKCLWIHQFAEGESPRITVVPDGCADIIWTSRGLAVVGPDRVTACPKITAGEIIFGARFRIGAAAPWLRVPLHEITGQTLPLDFFWGREAREIDARIREARGASERFVVLAAALRCRLSAVQSPPPDIAACIEHLNEVRGAAADPVRAIAWKTGISERTLRRRCHEYFGYGAKTLDRILRLQRFFTVCRHRSQGELAMLAMDAGYADQAHLTRETRQLTSLTPREIQRQLSQRNSRKQVEMGAVNV
ncbi:helix-turn-helix domain-containing protein [Sinorhizobium psoraleae]|uniref:Helix-turn-helix domain-containing protein n=1 Tax=Sinorhizobium psoraleae TaxID=520838 RepID=A0ABT4KLC0_9HYPH|nr:helix-turn-helix domain-containing protein [Sinorhizobium psoraleae]MCZ4092595.1 helix-turn-helix domain-containing protein [Sinorhizobium psoraleae]